MDPADGALQLQAEEEEAAHDQEAGPADVALDQVVAAGVDAEVVQPQQQQEEDEEIHRCLCCQKVFNTYEKLRRHQRRITCRQFFFD